MVKKLCKLLLTLSVGFIFVNLEQALAIEKDVGKKYFQKYCSTCHGTDGRGKGPAADALKNPPSDLTKIIRRSDGVWSPEEVASKIDGRTRLTAHGSREMPVWGTHFGEEVGGGEVGEEVSRGNIAVLVEYLKSIQD